MPEITDYRNDIPFIKKEMNLARYDNITGLPNDYSVFCFTKPILWLFEAESQIKFYHNGVLLKESTTFSDFYGYLTCIEDSCIQEIKDLKKRYKINSDSTLELVLELSVELNPLMECNKESDSAFKETRKQYYTLPDRLSTYNQGLTEKYWFEDKVEKRQKMIENKEIIFINRIPLLKKVVYSTLNEKKINLDKLKKEIEDLAEKKLNEIIENKKA